MIELMRCQRCGIEKLLSDFNFQNKEKGIRQPRCKSCHNHISQISYQNNLEKQRKRGRDKSKKLRDEHAVKIFEILSGTPCLDCGESDPIVLEFDHVHGEKFDDISRMCGRVNWSRIEEEITKCVVRCANCHRRKTARQFKWRIFEYAN